MKITVLFEGKPIDLSEIEAWEKKHSVAMTKRLQRKYKVTFPDGFIQRIPQMEIKKYVLNWCAQSSESALKEYAAV